MLKECWTTVAKSGGLGSRTDPAPSSVALGKSLNLSFILNCKQFEINNLSLSLSSIYMRSCDSKCPSIYIMDREESLCLKMTFRLSIFLIFLKKGV